MISKLLTLWLVVMVVVTPAKSQSVPPLINYQGKLTDAAGQPLASGTYQLRFQLWNGQVSDAARPNVVWGQDYNVTVINGVFNVILGAGGGTPVPGASVNDLSLAFTDPNRFLGVTILKDARGNAVNNPKEILPRQQLLSAPYAMKAAEAAIADGSVTPSKLAPRIVGTNAPLGGLALSAPANQALSAGPGNGPVVDILNLQVTLTTSGRPVMVQLIPTDHTTAANETTYSDTPLLQSGISFDNGGGDSVGFAIYINVDGKQISKTSIGAYSGNFSLAQAPGIISHVTSLPSGAHTIKIQAALSGTRTVSGAFRNVRLMAFEL